MATKSGEQAGIPLAQFIQQLRDELDRARKAAQGEDLQFDVGPIEVELAVQAQAKVGAGGGLRIYVFEAGAHGETANVSTQRIKLSLNPSLPETKPAAELVRPAAQAMTSDVANTPWPWLSNRGLTGLNAEYFVKSADGSDDYRVTVAPHGPSRTGVRVESPNVPRDPELPTNVDG